MFKLDGRPARLGDFENASQEQPSYLVKLLSKRVTYSDWRAYQIAAAAVFRRLGCNAQTEHECRGARSRHVVDVHATFLRSGIRCTWVVECKLWNRPVPKEKIMALKAIVDDLGADRGVIISERGFQSGAQDAARGMNITLVTSLAEFETTALAASTEVPLVCEGSEAGVWICKFPDRTAPHDLQMFGDHIITANWEGCSVSIVNPSTKTIVRTIDLDKYESRSPQGGKREIRGHPAGSLAIADGRLFVGQVFSEVILVIDLATHAIVRRIHIPGGGDGEMAVSSDEKTVYFASNKLNQFYIIDSATYAFTIVAYPQGGRGCMSLLRHPSRELLYIGIQRGGRINGRPYPHANSFLAFYDVGRECYLPDCQLAEVINGKTDDATPACITYDEMYGRIYVGMFQSMRGVVVVDEASSLYLSEIRMRRNDAGGSFPWADPLSQAVDGNELLSVNRNNCELAILDRATFDLKRVIALGEAPNGPKAVLVWRRHAVVAYPARNGLIFVSLENA